METTYPRDTFAQAGYKYIFQNMDGRHTLFNIHSGEFERWQASPHFAGYALKYKNTLLEFCSSYNEMEKDRLINYMRKVQNWGEQHPESHSAMMNVYRKYIAK
jgi:hypothetical protein